MYLYHKDATTIKEAMENIKRACALGGVSVVAPVEPRTTHSASFMQMTDSQDSGNESRKSDYVKFAGLKFQGKVEYIYEMLNKLDKMLEVIGVIQTQVQKMIDIGLEVGIVLEVDLEVEEGLSRTVLTAINQIMIGLIVIDIAKTKSKFVQETLK